MIPQETIDRIKQEINLADYVQSRGVKLLKNGKEYKGLCPFHEDTNPSFSVNPIMNLWYCHSCDNGGDVIKFVEMKDKLSFQESVRKLSGNGKHSTAVTGSRLTVDNPGRAALLSHVFEFYHKTFLEDQRGLEYLVSRGIENAELFKVVKLGFANGSLIKTLSDDHKKDLQEIGVLNKYGRELFHDCVVFPLFDHNNQIINLCGRSIKKNQHLFLPGVRRGLFYPSRGANRIIITEGVIDALTLLNHGIQNSLPIYGVNGLTDDHLNFLKRERIREIMLCLDADEAGRKAIPSITAKLDALGCAVQVVKLPDSEDVNSYFETNSKNDFLSLLEASETKKEDQEISEQAPEEKSIEGGFLFTFKDREYRVLGMNLHGLDRLRVNIKVTQKQDFHIDTLDLYAFRAREQFIKTASRLLNAVEEKISIEINTLIDVLESRRLNHQDKAPEKEPMTEEEKIQALKFLKSKTLLKEILKDFEACGTIGEETAKLFGYLATVSRFLAKPLGVLIVSRSGAGKSKLQEAVTDFVPPEDLQRYTRITGQSLFYKQGDQLKHKVLSIAEEKGAEDAIYSIRTLQSDQFLTVAVTITDPKTGQKRTEEYQVEGPVVILITTTNPEALDFETRNRFVILTIDESREQTRKILKMQRETDSIEGLIRSKNKDHILAKHHNAQRLLRKIHVVNPFADQLEYPDTQLLMRRDHQRYLTLIKTIAFLHQYQRDIHTVKTETGDTVEYIEVIPSDIKLANELAAEMMGRSLDELSPHTRSLLVEIKKMVDEQARKYKTHYSEISFTRRDICNYTGWTYWQVQEHLQQLLIMEYIVVHKGGKDNLYRYELVWDGQGKDGGRFITGLIDVSKLKKSVKSA